MLLGDKENSNSQQDSDNNEEDDEDSTEWFRYVMGALFPILLNFGFCVTAGVFLLQPVAER